jgi:hypothetical protein
MTSFFLISGGKRYTNQRLMTLTGTLASAFSTPVANDSATLSEK